MTWQPEPQGLFQLLSLLRDAIRPNNRDQVLVQQRLALFNDTPDYNSYLIHILVVMTQEDSYTRAIAGLTLKNNLLNHFNRIPLTVLDHVKYISLRSLDSPDPDATVRRTIGSVITAIIVRGQVLNWPEAIQVLAHHLESSNNPVAVEMALDTLQKICEDNAKDMSIATIEAIPVLELIIPRLIPFFSHPNTRLRVLSLSATNHFIPLKSATLLKYMNMYLQSLFEIITIDDNNEETEVRQEVCRSFVMLLDNFTESLLPYLNQLIEYMIFCNQSKNTKVALEACDFWNQFSRLRNLHEHLIPFLPRVIPVILNSLVYTEEDLLMFGVDDNQEDQQDDDLVHPRFNNRFMRSSHRYNNRFQEEEEDDDDDDDDNDQEDDEFFSEWTLRKFSATSLEALTAAFKSKVTDILLPLLNHALFSSDWRMVESGILALGAAAEGDIFHRLPEMIPFLVTNLSNPNAHVRYITCWTVSRFSNWIISQCTTETGRTQFYEPVLRELLRRILDRSDRVQEAACCAFSTLEEQATEQELVPYLPVILNHLTRALRLYRNRNLRLLYDTIGTLAESVGPSLNEPGCIAVLMPPLISRWNRLEDNDSDLFPLLGCLTDIATSLGIGFLPFTEPVFTRCVMLISNTLNNTIRYEEYDDELEDELDDEFIVVPLDLLSGIVQGLGNTVEPFVRQSTLLPLLAVCSHYDSRCEVLQPTYALIGDLSKACFSTLEPYLENIMPALMRQLENEDVTFKSARNNAIWALGEISIRYQKEKMERYVDPMLRCLIPFILPHSNLFELQENTITTIGRLGIHYPEIAARFLPHFSRAWLYRSRSMRENDEKESAFLGFCNMVILFPHALHEVAIRMLLDTIGQWQNPSPSLKLLFDQVTCGYRGLLTEAQWNQVSPYMNNNPNNAAAVQ